MNFILQVMNTRRPWNKASCTVHDDDVTHMQLLLRMMVKEVPLGEEAVL